MDKKDIVNMQNRVEAWVSQPQHKVKYFPSFQIVAQLIEEVKELEEEATNIVKNKIELEADIKKEIGDVLFVLCCLSNSKNISPEPEKVSVGLVLPNNICLKLYRLTGDVSREVSHIDGFKKKKPGEDTEGLPNAINKMFFVLQTLCDYYKFDFAECFDLTMQKKESRDKFRFAK